MGQISDSPIVYCEFTRIFEVDWMLVVLLISMYLPGKHPFFKVFYYFVQFVQSRITLPQLPDFISSNPVRYSLTGRR